jgi:hypothetical protein
VDEAVRVVGRAVGGNDFERLIGGGEKIVLRSGWYQHNIPGAKRLLIAIQDNSPSTLHQIESLIIVGMCFSANFPAGWNAHDHDLKMLTGGKYMPIIFIRNSLLFDVLNSSHISIFGYQANDS